MNFHEVTEKDGHKLDVLTNREQTLRILVSRRGAELVSFAKKGVDGKWVGFFYRDGDVSKNPAGWNNHSTVMGYYIHRIVDETTSYRGQTITGSTHSFLRHKTFAPPEIEGNSLTYRLLADQIDPNEYPFQVDFSLVYELTAEELVVTFRFDNREDFPAHISFGLHPGFAVTSLEDARVDLAPGRYVRHLAPNNFLSGETETLDFAGGSMPFDKAKLPGSFLLDLAGVAKRIFSVEDIPTGRRIVLDYESAPYLTLWSDGGPFVCVEPCWGLPDHHAQRCFEDKLGIQVVEAHGKMERSLRMKPTVLSH